MFGPKGEHLCRTAYIGLPRKNGKSTLGAALALYGLVADGESGPEVYSCAGDRQQARIVFDEAKRMVAAEPELAERLTVYRWHIENPTNNGIYRALSADAALQQGLSPSFVIFDEVHVQPNRDLWDAMTLGRGARSRPMVIGITTAGFDKGSLAWNLYEHGRQVTSGEVDDPTFFYRWWEPKDATGDWKDGSTWADANPALDDFLFRAALEEDARITPESAFRRYHLNQWTTTRNAWLPHGAWESCADLERVVQPGEAIVVGFDGSRTNDATALVGCTIERPHLFLIKVWEKPRDEPAWQVPTHEVTNELLRLSGTYNMQQLACDPFQWRDRIVEWDELGLPVVEWPTNSVQRMAPACAEFYRAVGSHAVTHDGDPVLARHIANAVIKEDRYGMRIVKDRSSMKIDAAVAAVIAHDIAQRGSVAAPNLW